MFVLSLFCFSLLRVLPLGYLFTTPTLSHGVNVSERSLMKNEVKKNGDLWEIQSDTEK